MRTTTIANHINRLVLIQIHEEINAKPEKMLNLFAKQNSRRQQFCK